MKLLKENFYDVVRLYINQIGITIFSFMLYTAVDMVDDDGLNLKIKVALSIFATLFYFALLYNLSWEWGAKDKIRVDGGRMTRNAAKGAILALYANVPSFILAIAATATKGAYMLGAGDAVNSAHAVINLIMRLFSAMYLGIIQGVFVSFESNTDLYFLLQSAGYIVMPLFAVLATHIGYRFGLAERRIFPTASKPKSKD